MSHSAAVKIGLFGGTFDPPHNGHVALVEAALSEMGLDEVWILPAEPVHRSLSGHADGLTRLRWLQAIFEGIKGVQVVDWEVTQGRPVAAVETLKAFRKHNPGVTPWLMLGADAWMGLESWREYPLHCEYCNVVVFARSGLGVEQLPDHDEWKQVNEKQWQECKSPGHWCYMPVSLPAVAATDVRHDAEMGRELTGKVPEKVRTQIETSYRLDG